VFIRRFGSRAWSPRDIFYLFLMQGRGGPPPWIHENPHDFPPRPPPPPGPHMGWYDRPPPWRDNFDGPPRPPPPWDHPNHLPPPHPQKTPSSFADDDFDIPPSYPSPPRGRGRGGNVRSGNQTRGGGIPNRGGGPPMRGSISRGRGPARGTFSPRGAWNSRGANRGASFRGVPGRRGVVGRGNGRGRVGATGGTPNLRITSSSNGNSINWLAKTKGEDGEAHQSTETTMTSQQTEVANSVNQNMNSVADGVNMGSQNLSEMGNAQMEQKEGQRGLLRACVPGDPKFISFKNSLQECCQKQHLHVPDYKTWKNLYGFSAKVEVAGNTFKSTGIQSDRKEAEQNVAYNALLNLGLIDSTVSFDVKTAAAIKRPGMKRPAIDNTENDVHGKRGKRAKLETVSTSYKSRLNEFCQKFRLSIPSYDTVKADTGKEFITTIVFNKKVYQSNGSQPTKKLAEQNAAQVVLHMLNQCPAPAPSHQEFVEHCKKMSSQNASTASNETSTATTTLSTASVSVHQIPLPTPPPADQPVSTLASIQPSTTSTSTFSGPKAETISTPDHQPSTESTTTAKPASVFTSHKNSLQEHCQKNKLALPVYSSVRENGVFTCTVQVAGKSFTSTACNTKKGSEQTAANVALKGLGLV